MLRKLVAASLLLMPLPAHAKIPLLNATCGAVDVHADPGGPVVINGKVASVKKFSDTYYEARLGQIAISLAINPDGTLSLTDLASSDANGNCKIASPGSSG